MLHELFITHFTNGTSIMNPFTFIKDSYDQETLLEARKLEKLEIQLSKSRTHFTNSTSIMNPFTFIKDFHI